MATPCSLTPCSAPQIQVGRASKVAWAPASAMERYWVRSVHPAEAAGRAASQLHLAGRAVRVLGEHHAGGTRGAQRVAHGRSVGRLDYRWDDVEPRAVLALDQIDLSDLDFWARPWDEREGAFQTLRRERPMAFFEEPEIPEALASCSRRGPATGP